MPGVFLIAGESSGDAYGALLAAELRRQRPNLVLAGAGGPRMKEAGVHLHADLTRHAVIGITEAVRHLASLHRILHQLVHAIQAQSPKVIVPIDYIEFNMRLAKEVRPLQIPIVYYVSPQVWAWRPWRIRTIARRVDKMLVLFDFEEKLYRDRGVDVSFVGHPMCDVLDGRARVRTDHGPPWKIGLLPGSRISEFSKLFPVMLGAARILADTCPQTEFVLGCSPNIPEELVQAARDRSPVPFVTRYGGAYDVMGESDLLLVASGTACLEASLLQTPMVVLYKLNLGTLALFALLKRTSMYAMPNILCGRRVVPEMMQWNCTAPKVAAVALDLIRNARLAGMSAELAEVREHLAGPGATARAAAEVLRFIPPDDA